MGIHWPSITTEGGDMEDSKRTEARVLLDEFGDAVTRHLSSLGLRLHTSPFFRPFSLATVRDGVQFLVGLAPGSGMAQMMWWDRPGEAYSPTAMVDLLSNQLGWEVSAVISLPLPNDPQRASKIATAAAAHAKEIETAQALGKLGNIQDVHHLEPYLRKFLEDHPEPDRNVFIMMRFSDTPQLKQIHDAVVTCLTTHGMNAVRADDRDYTGDLWSNIEVYLTGCKYGIAVFEDVDQRDYNPNVSLELGYLMGRGKRTLLLKEKRLPRVPSDVAHRLYKEFDIFDIEDSINREVGRWISVDLKLRF